MEQELTPQEKTIKKLRVYMESTKTSQSKVAKACNISESRLSGYLQGTYTGDSEETTLILEDYLRLELGRAKFTKKIIVPTQNYQTIVKFFGMVQTHKIMGVLTGEAGVGKTEASKSFVQRYPANIMIEVDPGYNSLVLFEELCETLNLETRGTLHAKVLRVINKLRGSGRMLIIDEAEHLPYRALELLRRVYDKAEVGISLVGLPRLERNIKGDPDRFAQLYSRISLPCRSKNMTDADVRLILETYFSEIDEDIVSLCAKYSRRNLRLLSIILLWSNVILCKYKEKKLTRDIVSSAADMLSVAA